ncbi:hypothetical protein D3C86_1143110 [compost metagenome]
MVAHLQVVDLGHDAILRRIHRGVREVQLRLVELRPGLAHRRVTVGNDVRIAVQGNHGAGDLLLDGGDPLPRHFHVGVGAFVDGLRHERRRDQGLLAGKILLVEVSRLFRRLQFRLLLAVAGLEPVDTQPRHAELRLGAVDGDLEGFRIDPEQRLALADLLIVLDGDLNHLPGDPRIDRCLRHPGVSVIGRNISLPRNMVGIAQRREEDRNTHHQPGTQRLSQQFSGGRADRVGARLPEGL